MSKITLSLVLAGLLLVATFGLIQVVQGQAPLGQGNLEPIESETQGDNLRQIYGPADGISPEQPVISFIDSPTPTCYLPDPAQDSCYINWYYMAVDANPSSMVVMTATINSIGIVSRYQGFFQTSMYVPFSLHDRGFKVTCGAPGAGGNPNLGNAYAWNLQARAANGLRSANYGTVYCPPFSP